MQKFIFLFSAAVILGLTACEKCSTCTILGVESAEYCGKGDDYDAWETACEASGGTLNEK